jgi:uncharacterized membrane protein
MSAILQTISHIISYISIAIICYGAIIGLWKFVQNEFTRLQGRFTLTKIVQIKLEVGRYLLLGLEFLIASDIIDTVVIRTGLSFFLNKEIEDVKQDQAS